AGGAVDDSVSAPHERLADQADGRVIEDPEGFPLVRLDDEDGGHRTTHSQSLEYSHRGLFPQQGNRRPSLRKAQAVCTCQEIPRRAAQFQGRDASSWQRSDRLETCILISRSRLS